MYKKINKTVIIDDDQNTKLHYAAALDNVEEINKIIASKQKLDPENYLGWTPLMMAIRNENASAVDTLLLHGANPIKKNKFGESFLFRFVLWSSMVSNFRYQRFFNECGVWRYRNYGKNIKPFAL